MDQSLLNPHSLKDTIMGKPYECLCTDPSMEITPYFSGINAQEFKSWVPTVNPCLVLKGTAHLFSRKAVPLYILTARTEGSRCSASSVLSIGYPLATLMTKCVMISEMVLVCISLMANDIEQLVRCGFSFFFLAHHKIFIQSPGTEPRLLALKLQSPTHWTARKFPHFPNKFFFTVILRIL